MPHESYKLFNLLKIYLKRTLLHYNFQDYENYINLIPKKFVLELIHNTLNVNTI